MKINGNLSFSHHWLFTERMTDHCPVPCRDILTPFTETIYWDIENGRVERKLDLFLNKLSSLEMVFISKRFLSVPHLAIHNTHTHQILE